VSDLQHGSPLAPVTVVVRSPYLGIVARRSLALAGCANVSLMLLRQVAERVGARSADDDDRQPLTGVLEAAAIRAAVDDDPGGAFAQVAHHPVLHDSLASLFRDLRRLNDPEAALDTIGAKGRVANTTVQAFRRFVDLTAPFFDGPDLARRAAMMASRSHLHRASDLGVLVLYLPASLDEASLAMLGSLGQRLPVIAAFAHTGESPADTLQEHDARTLARLLGAPPPTAAEIATTPAAEIRLVSAPDPAEEVRSVVRQIAADLEAGVPLWRTAVLYGQEETYGGLVRDVLDAAEIPWHAALGRPLTGNWAARSLLSLLELRERRFAREAVLDWLSSRPPLEVAVEDPLQHVPVSAWDRISRRAQVVQGASQWSQRCTTLAASLGHDEQRARPFQTTSPGPEPVTPDSAHAHAIAAAMIRLSADTRPPRDGSTWDAFIAWAEGLRAAYLPSAQSWPAPKQTGSEAVDATIKSLADAGQLEATTTFRTFRTALAAALESRRLTEGTPGVGVVVSQVGAILGAQFDRVYIVGAIEGVFPGRPPADPLASSQTGVDPLGRRERQGEIERRAWLGALAAADGQRVVVSYPRSDGAVRSVHPSRWLLEIASRLAGRAVYASDLPRLLDEGAPWLTRIASAYDGLSTISASVGYGDRTSALGSLADVRLAGVIAWHAAGADLARHPLAQRPNLPLGAAIRASRARRSRQFTPYDGNLAELAGASRLMTRAFRGGHSSASGMELWASCHFRYLLQNILRVQVTERPEEEWTISPLERGSLVHAVLETFFRELRDAGRFDPGDAFTPADHARLDDIANLEFRRVEAEGRTGHPLTWENARAAILTDLQELLERDHGWRVAEGLRPAYVEQPFGYPSDTSAWPAAAVTLADGRSVLFRGSIDRIDLSPPDASPRRALIVDYKTGSATPFAGLDDDPLLGGQHLQLALYARALRTQMAPSDASLDVSAEFRFITGRGRFQRLKVLGNDDLDARLDRAVQRVADGVGAGVFLPVPGERDRGTPVNCRYCDYDRVCSATRDEAWERKHDQIGPAQGPWAGPEAAE
jgi:ATP-dependent helicase/nuclease subunit B